MRRGGHRLSVERTTNHTQAWKWRIVDLRTTAPWQAAGKTPGSPPLPKGERSQTQLAITEARDFSNLEGGSGLPFFMRTLPPTRLACQRSSRPKAMRAVRNARQTHKRDVDFHRSDLTGAPLPVEHDLGDFAGLAPIGPARSYAVLQPSASGVGVDRQQQRFWPPGIGLDLDRLRRVRGRLWYSSTASCCVTLKTF